MALVRLQLVKLGSIDPDEDCLVSWFYDLKFWDPEIECRVRAAEYHLPLDIEYRFRDMNKLPVDHTTKKLLTSLLGSDVGISLKRLGFSDGGWNDPDTCVGKILSLKLGRVQDHERFKAVKYAFDPRIQYLIGVESNLN
ncbi:MAG: hypothetical protein UU39_C0042G0004 [Candidatus Woesebacteria bacterium GW2011_GWD1_41_12]|uniref:Uncharacterized protein n=3 Tax=Candidatus Woeseibacteriota TaxID=1752722 RepID=A0A1F8CXA0_9BACT|nr:MAG: hypothetical protein UU39_C0042G0004 [Candidatus Woesebacteria bacterium GW2011_GWD1_41_12]KKS05610.1 MAG: hypothetical protein UU57_C0003G0001 [Candidatus Woesebacteria bacterium GW2011_GWE1_41_24]OGM80726.1 MAG: hypothetical protein A2393_02715 [Candidatus Woesebacteria bacterium RIFOXYB1_FULL_41_13]